MTGLVWKSTHGTGDSDIYQSGDWELVRKILGFDIERVTIIKAGERVHQIEAQDGLRKAMDWCSPPYQHEHGDGP